MCFLSIKTGNRFSVKKNICLILCILLYLGNVIASKDTLALVHVLFRHGDRTPNNNTNMYPKDPYLQDDFYPYGRGQLTDKGKLKSYNLGKELRARYNDFLGELWLPNILLAQTSDVMRTKMSMELVLAGLFPPTRPKWLAKMKWQPIPQFNLPLRNDPVLFGIACSSYSKHKEEYFKSPVFVSLQQRLPEFAAYILEHTGANYTCASDMAILHHLLVQEEECGRKLPEWTNSVYPQPIRSIAMEVFEEMNATPELTRLMSGGLLRKIINDTLLHVNAANNTTKIYLYSAHDITVASLLINLGVFKRHLPPYGCYISLEVHKVQGVHGIKVYYQDYTKKKLQLLKIPGCKRFCPLDDFLRLVSKGVLDEEC